MIPDALDFILCPVTDEQAEYAAAQDRITDRPLGMTCSRCHQPTGNNNQGHYWGLCKALMAQGVPHRKAVRKMHFCCPGDCELETTVPAEEGEADAGAVKSSASPSLPQGEADQTPACPTPSGRGIGQAGPQWSAVDDDTADLLSLVASEHPAIPQEEREWEHFVAVLQEVALATGLIDQNVTRPLLRGEVKPQRVGAFFHRATKAGLIRVEGWNTSDDLEGKNGGKPARVYRWLGT